MCAAIGAAGARPTVFQPPAGLTGPTSLSFLSPISTPSQLGLTPRYWKSRPLEAPYHHLALGEIVKAWQVRLDGQGHLKLAHDAAVAREGGIGARLNYCPVSCCLPMPTGPSLLNQSTGVKARSFRLWDGCLFSNPLHLLCSRLTGLLAESVSQLQRPRIRGKTVAAAAPREGFILAGRVSSWPGGFFTLTHPGFRHEVSQRVCGEAD